MIYNFRRDQKLLIIPRDQRNTTSFANTFDLWRL